MNKILQGLGDENLWVRISYAYAAFFILLGLSYALGLTLLPKGFMRNLPIPAFAFFGESTQSFYTLFSRTFIYNLFVWLLIIGMNIFRVQQFTFGYLPLYANTVLLGLFAGTDSFSGGVSATTLDGWLAFLQIGFLEFSAYILGCAATVKLAMFHADRWRGEPFRRIRSWKAVSLSKGELVILAIAFALLSFGAFNEWRFEDQYGIAAWPHC